jgi:Flp pilus assembly secretin CpaC
MNAAVALLLVAGMQTTVELPFDPCGNVSECIKVANKALFSVQYSRDKRQLILMPIKRGETTITIRDERGDIRTVYEVAVSEHNLPRFAAELRDLFKDLKKVNVHVNPSGLLVDGAVSEPEQIRRVQEVLAGEPYKSAARSLVVLDTAGMKAAAAQLQAGLGEAGVTVKPFGAGFVLEGKVRSKADAERVEILARKLAGALFPLAPPEAAQKLVVSKLNTP